MHFFLIISTYNFYHKFRPTFLSIFREISKYEEKNKGRYYCYFRANSKEELKYNNSLEKKLKKILSNLL